MNKICITFAIKRFSDICSWRGSTFKYLFTERKFFFLNYEVFV